MKIDNSRGWEDILFELNNFECKIEFLQSETRRVLLNNRKINMDNYFTNVKQLLSEHECNLFLIPKIKNDKEMKNLARVTQ